MGSSSFQESEWREAREAYLGTAQASEGPRPDRKRSIRRSEESFPEDAAREDATVAQLCRHDGVRCELDTLCAERLPGESRGEAMAQRMLRCGA